MDFIIEPNEHKAYTSLGANNSLVVPPWLQGEVRPLQVSIANKIQNPNSVRLFSPIDLTGWSLRAALGQGFLQPVAGDFTLSFNGDTSGNLPYNATAAEIEGVLNAVPAIDAVGGVDVEGSNGFFLITFRDDESQPEITGDGSGLAPLSIIDSGTLIDGATQIREVQTIRIFQNPAAYADLTVESAPATANVVELQAGGGGNNAKFQIWFSENIYDGGFSIAVDGEESSLLPFDATGEAVQGALESLTSVGVGNVNVSQSSEGSYTIGFKGALADTAVTLTADDAALVAMQSLSGDLSLRTSAIDLLLQTGSTEVIFEIEGTNPDGKIEKLFRSNEAPLIFSIIGESSSTPPPGPTYYNSAASDARYLQKIGAGSTLPNGYTLTFGSGAVLTTAAGSTVNINGALNGTPTGGTLDLSNVTLTLPGGPVFQASSSVDFVTTGGFSPDVMPLATEDFDPSNCYNPSNYRFTPNKAGYYKFEADIVGSTDANLLQVFLHKNGTQVYRPGFKNVGSTAYVCFGDVVYLNGTTDYVQIGVATNVSLTVTNSMSPAKFRGFYLRP